MKSNKTTCKEKCCFNCQKFDACRSKDMACGEPTNKDCVGVIDNNCPNFIKKEEKAESTIDKV